MGGAVSDVLADPSNRAMRLEVLNAAQVPIEQSNNPDKQLNEIIRSLEANVGCRLTG